MRIGRCGRLDLTVPCNLLQSAFIWNLNCNLQFQFCWEASRNFYTMKGLGKVHPPDNKVLEDIWLSFYFGAKIGVLGLNGAGKSSLLRIMAGEDTSFLGEAFAAPGISIGFLQQEPRLDPAKDVLGNVEEGVAPVRALLTSYDTSMGGLAKDLTQ